MSQRTTPRPRTSFSKLSQILDVPDLISIQLDSFKWFLDEGLKETIADINPIEDYTNKYAVEFGDYEFKAPNVSLVECRDKDMTYASPLFITVPFVNRETGEIREQSVFMGDFPVMTEQGTFIINGTERVIVTQLVRSPGAYVMQPKDTNKLTQVLVANLMPSRGSWLEFEIDKRGSGQRAHRPQAQAAGDRVPAGPGRHQERSHGRPPGGDGDRHRRGDPRPLRQQHVHPQHLDPRVPLFCDPADRSGNECLQSGPAYKRYSETRTSREIRTKTSVYIVPYVDTTKFRSR